MNRPLPSVRLVLIGVVLLSVGCSSQIDQQDPIVVWLLQNAIPLTSLNSGSGLHDLRPLKPVLRDVRIVALGEATHGTREFFRFKHLMLKSLAKELGFTVFGIEASYAECLNINDYVLHGKGDRSEALTSQGFWTWDTEEVLAMIHWMREYNMSVAEPRRIKFYGFDFQQHSQAAEVVLEFLKKDIAHIGQTIETGAAQHWRSLGASQP